MTAETRVEHTPTPWRASKASVFAGETTIAPLVFAGVGEDEPYTGRHLQLAYANAEFIVRAVNAHDDLVAALECRDIDPDVTALEWVSAVVTDVRAAMANGDWEPEDPLAMQEALNNITYLVTRGRAALEKARS